MNKLNSIFILISLVFAITVSANDKEKFKQAEQLFEQRHLSVENIHSAREIYRGLLKGSKDLLVKRSSLDRIGRLAGFEGDVAKDFYHTKNSYEIFEECTELSEILAPHKIGVETAEYFYWRAACKGLSLAHMNKAKAIVVKDKIIKEILGLITFGQQQFKAYDGYGFSRMEAALYSESIWVGKIYDPKKALNLIEECLHNGGNNFYMNYMLKAEILKKIGKTKEAKKTLDDAIDDLSNLLNTKKISKDLLPENTIFLSKMEAMKKDFNKGFSLSTFSRLIF